MQVDSACSSIGQQLKHTDMLSGFKCGVWLIRIGQPRQIDTKTFFIKCWSQAAPLMKKQMPSEAPQNQEEVKKQSGSCEETSENYVWICEVSLSNKV